MFTPDSRYLRQPTYTVTRADGSQVTVVVPRQPVALPLVGWAPKNGETRLDLVALQYLAAPTGFWRLCDANSAMLAGSLQARSLIGIPEGGVA